MYSLSYSAESMIPIYGYGINFLGSFLQQMSYHFEWQPPTGEALSFFEIVGSVQPKDENEQVSEVEAVII